jgi:membrane-associated phospholipid phosphatase
MDETVTGEQLSILIIVIPIGTFLLGNLYPRRSLVDLHHSLLTLLEGFALVTMFKRWMNLVGRYRPNFQAVEATKDASEIEAGRQSYPSGHAAYMFLAMTITTLYLLGRTKVFACPRPGNFALSFLCLAPVVLATFVAVTRPANHKHHFSDINAGMFIGLATGLFAYLLNYESVFHPALAGLPKCRPHTTPQWILLERERAGEAAAPAGLHDGERIITTSLTHLPCATQPAIGDPLAAAPPVAPPPPPGAPAPTAEPGGGGGGAGGPP